jgi:hypothetical protein
MINTLPKQCPKLFHYMMSKYTPFKLDIAASDHSSAALLLPPPKDSSETFPIDTLSLLCSMVQQTLLLNCIQTTNNTTKIKYLTDVMTFSYFNSKTSKTFRIRDTDGLKQRTLEVAFKTKTTNQKFKSIPMLSTLIQPST